MAHEVSWLTSRGRICAAGFSGDLEHRRDRCHSEGARLTRLHKYSTPSPESRRVGLNFPLGFPGLTSRGYSLPSLRDCLQFSLSFPGLASWAILCRPFGTPFSFRCPSQDLRPGLFSAVPSGLPASFGVLPRTYVLGYSLLSLRDLERPLRSQAVCSDIKTASFYMESSVFRSRFHLARERRYARQTTLDQRGIC